MNCRWSFSPGKVWGSRQLTEPLVQTGSTWRWWAGPDMTMKMVGWGWRMELSRGLAVGRLTVSSHSQQWLGRASGPTVTWLQQTRFCLSVSVCEKETATDEWKKKWWKEKKEKKIKQWWKKERRSEKRKREEGRMDGRENRRKKWLKEKKSRWVSESFFFFKGERVTAWDCHQNKKMNYESWTMSELLKRIVIADVTSSICQFSSTSWRMEGWIDSPASTWGVCARVRACVSVSLPHFCPLIPPFSTLQMRDGDAGEGGVDLRELAGFSACRLALTDNRRPVYRRPATPRTGQTTVRALLLAVCKKSSYT